MIEQSIIVALIVLSIHYTLQPGEIFGRLGDWLERKLPKAIHKPVFDCNVCMTMWYGSAIYWAIWGAGWLEWLIVVITAMGINILINKWAPDKDA